MAAGFVRGPVDSTGKKVQTFENTIGVDVVESQGVVLVDTAGVAIKGQQTAANSLPVVLSTDGPFASNVGLQADTAATTDTGSFSLIAFTKRALQNWTTLLAKTWPVTLAAQPGAANTANGQVTASTTAATLIVARATRRYAIARNTDAALSGYLGIATVTAANGMPVKAGESVRLDTTALVQVLAASGSPVFAFIEFYD